MTADEKTILRDLAAKWMEISQEPVMAERKRQWTVLKDLKAEKPMILVETAFIEGYVQPDEIKCSDIFLRKIEENMRQTIRHAREVGDDMVVEPVYRINWDYSFSGNGFSGVKKKAVDSRGRSHAYVYENSIKSAEDIKLYRKRIGEVNRKKTYVKKQILEDAFGDILPVEIHGSSTLNTSITRELFQLLGMERMMMWQYDEPDALNELLELIHDSRKGMFKWLEEEGLLGLNNNSCKVGSGSPGFTSALPADDFNGTVRRKDMWLWVESQETSSISPADFEEFYLPHLADVGRDFGFVYYGCCEPVHDRWDRITKQIPNIRAVSISPWCDRFVMGEKLGKDYVFSVKPFPAYISGNTPDWTALRKDVEDIFKAADKCNLELIFRDLIDLGGDRKRLANWVSMVRKIAGT